MEVSTCTGLQLTHSLIGAQAFRGLVVSQSQQSARGSIVIMQVLGMPPAFMHKQAGVTRRCLVTGSDAVCNLFRVTRTRQRTFGDDIHRIGRAPCCSRSVISGSTTSSAGQPAFIVTAPGPEPTTFELACPICTDTQFELGADRYQLPAAFA